MDSSVKEVHGLKILQINSVCGYGSTGRIAADLYRLAEKNGYDCLIAYGRGSAPQDIASYKIDAPFNVNLHGALSRITDKHGFYSRQATRRLLERIDAYHPDLIHLHNIHGYYLNIELLFHYLKATQIPVVWTLHDCWAFTGHCAHFDYAGCDKWKKGCGHCPQLRAYPASLVADRSAWNYQKKEALFTSLKQMNFVVPSEWLADLVRSSFLGKYPITVIPNGIDLSVFRPISSNFRERYHLEEKRIYLGVASVWGNRKGLQDFIQLSQMLEEKEQIILVGVTEAQKKNLPSNILGITRTNNADQLAEIYTAADVFVNPTWEDSFPTTNLEALACGTPVVTYQTGGSPESLDPSCGFIVKKYSIDELLTAIREIQVDAEACRNKALQYDKNARFQEYMNLYQELLGGISDGKSAAEGADASV